MLKVVVAEKPSVARDLARVLGAKQRRDHWLARPGQEVELRITWTLGHLVELEPPDAYDPGLKRWRLETLPFVPERFRLRPSGDASAKAQLEAVSNLCREADELVCATDAGREGELIFRYVLEFAGVADRPFQRLWLQSMTDEAIRSAFSDLRDRSQYETLFEAARARSEADWIVGLNGTRYHTVRFGTRGVLWSVGRVQTPVLSLIAERDDEIRTFDPEAFWELRTRYREVWFQRVAGRFDEENPAKAVLEAVRGEEFEIVSIEGRREQSPPPLLHDLTSLQRQLNAATGMSAARCLEVVQQLYERKLVTYPRTDSRHLPADAANPTKSALRSLQQVLPNGAERLDLSSLPTPRRMFADSKVSDHHAIIPTGSRPSGLDSEAQAVFDAVLARTVQGFMPDRLRDITEVQGKAGEELFRARGTVVVDPGWFAIEWRPSFGRPKSSKKTPRSKGGKKPGATDGDLDDSQELPAFEKGERGAHEPELHEGKTKAPRPWTENSILGAMETAGKFVDDESLREALKARGLGTPATRASILETLIRRGYIERVRKTLRVTDLGRILIGLIEDPRLRSPELTGDWEQKLRGIEQGELEPGSFREEIVSWIGSLCRPAPDGESTESHLGPCPRCGQPVIRGREKFGCSAWKTGCEFTLPGNFRGTNLGDAVVARLLRKGICFDPVRTLEGDARVLALTRTGALIDLDPPVGRDRNKRSGPSGGGSRATSRTRRKSSSGGSKPKSAASKKPVTLPSCPRCNAPLIEGQRGFGCSRWSDGCRFVVWREIQGKKVTPALLKTLVEKGVTRLSGGFLDAAGNEFRGRLRLGDDGAAVEPE
ncbi:MAG: DNA topoisomerase [Planctomycetota bacterium]